MTPPITLGTGGVGRRYGRYNRDLREATDEGARVSVRRATIGDDDPASGFFAEDGPLPW
ncbi:hypothetical protein [Amycolatopsis sp. NBC_00438]|uniref:hypothetical protein n=1 Tax=Amycolatopsis sp. NBC_00438 TaxID=2903558 RepID=UPI002E1AD1D3